MDGCLRYGDDVYYERDLTGPIAVVIGGEGSGVSRLVKEKCDFTVSIPMKGEITSLTATNAASITISHRIDRLGTDVYGKQCKN